jgi:phosphate acyltransferase
VGTEKGKGNEQAKAAFDLLENASLNFIGNMEGRDLLNHVADVVVCDGFVGNIMLKLGESVATGLKTMIADEMKKLQLSAEEQMLVGKVMHQVQKRFDYEEYGGAPLLGINGTVMIGHGGSSAKAMANMVLSGANVAEQNVNQAIQEALSA